MIKVTYIDHSGFVLSTKDAVLVFDYRDDPHHKLERVIHDDPDVPVIFFVTHHHDDHFNSSIFELAQDRKRCYVLSNDIFADVVPEKGISVAWMSPGDVVEQIPGIKSVKAYASTDEGVAYVVTLLDGQVVFHAGDLNDWSGFDKEEARERQRDEAKFRTIVNRIAEDFPEVKVAMFPVDERLGDEFADGAKYFLGKVKVENFFPMHFWGEPHKACDFVEYVPTPSTRCYCLDTPGKTIEVI